MSNLFFFPPSVRRMILFFSFLMLAANADAQAQHWAAIATPISHIPLQPYFVNTHFGFLYLPNATDLYRTSDEGKSWQQINTFSDNQNFLTHLDFLTPEHGYASALNNGFGVGGGVYETLDSGTHWKIITPQNTSARCVYATPSIVFAIVDIGAGRGILSTTDDGQTWVDAVLPTSANLSFITGNLDSIVGAVSEDTTQANLVFSTNLGKTWSGQQFVMQGDTQRLHASLLAVPHTPWLFRQERIDTLYNYFRGIPNNGWQPSLQSVKGGLWPAGLECALYIPDASKRDFGLYRSLDLGVSWQFIDGPDFRGTEKNPLDFQRLSVVGHGAVVYAMDGFGLLWRTTDGGDGLLGTSLDLNGSKAYEHSLQAFLGCDSAHFSFSMQFKGCLTARFDSLTLESPDSSAVSSHTIAYYVKPHSRRSYSYDTVFVTIFPKKSGTFPLIFHAKFSDGEEPQYDIPMPLTVIIHPDTGRKLDLTPAHAIDFGDQALCTAILRSDTVHLASYFCGIERIDSIVFYPVGPQSTDFGFRNTLRSVLIDQRTRINSGITFKPTHAGLERGTVVVYSPNETDSLTVTGRSHLGTHDIGASSDTVLVPPCSSGSTVLKLANRGCGTVLVDSISVPNGFSIPPLPSGQAQLPLPIFAGATEDITLNFTPVAGVTVFGNSTAHVTAHTRYVEGLNTTSTDTLLPITLNVGRGGAEIIAPNFLDGRTTTVCSGVSTGFHVLSTGCDSVHITSEHLSSGTAFALLTAPKDLAPGASDSVRIAFRSTTPGDYLDTLIIETNAGTKRIPLQVIVKPGTHLLTASLADINFGTTTLCEEHDTTIELKNLGCDSLTITAYLLQGSGFICQGSLPKVLAPGESAFMKIVTMRDTTGHPDHSAASVHIVSTSETAPPDITLLRGYTYPGSLTVTMTCPNSGGGGQTAMLRLNLAGSAPRAITALHFNITHNDDLLSFQTLASAGLTLDATQTVAGVMTQSFTLSPIYFGSIGQLVFTTKLARALVTPITLNNLRFDQLDPASDCIASINDSAASLEYTYQYSCGDDMIHSELVNGNLGMQNYPNPASELAYLPFHISVEIPQSQALLTIFDETGSVRYVAREIASLGDRAFVVQTRSLPSGKYFYRIALTSGEVLSSRELVVVH